MNKLMDMHIHTYYSDGEYSPNDVIKTAYEKGISVMGITDHDTIDGVKNIDRSLDYISSGEIKVINGIEIGCKCDYGNMHILGYDFDINNYDLNKWLEVLKTNRLNSTLSVMEQIKRDFGITFNYQDIINLINKYSIGRPDLARLCVKYGFCNTVSEAFNMFLNPAKEKTKDSNKRISYQECFKLIKNSGGLVVLAHPNSILLNKANFEKLICDMIECGLDGIEVYHSNISDEESSYYLNLANKYGLLISGGSDYHGPFVKPDISIGTGRGNLKIKRLSLVDEIMKRRRL